MLDEADEMLQMGFAEDVERILADTPEYKQVALFSATMPPAIRKITSKYLHDAVEVAVKSKTATAENITQRYIQVAGPRKMDALTRLLEVEPFEAMIVFVRTKQATEEVAEKLRARGFAASAINGDIPQALRERTIAALKDGSIDILVATDVAARGLDVERISHVLNYDIPHDPESYVHRIGRTGRAGRSGTALLFVSPRERHLLKSIEKVTRQPVTEVQLPSVEDVNAQRVAKFQDSITEALNAPGFDMFRRSDRGLRARQRRADGRHRRGAGTAVPRRGGVPDDRAAAGETARAARARRTGTRPAQDPRRPGDLSHLGRQEAQGGSRLDRRRDRQRRRPAPQRFRPHRHQERLLTGRVARQTGAVHAESP